MQYPIRVSHLLYSLCRTSISSIFYRVVTAKHIYFHTILVINLHPKKYHIDVSLIQYLTVCMYSYSLFFFFKYPNSDSAR